MSLILSGTNGLSDVDGTAATPAIRGTDANTGIFFPAADQLAASVNGIEGLRLTSTGLGIGTSSPAGPFEVVSQNSNDSGMYLTADGSSFGYASNLFFRSKLTTGGSIGVAAKIRAELSSSNNAGLLFFTTASGTNAEKMRLDSSGNLLVGTTVSSISSGAGIKFIGSSAEPYMGIVTPFNNNNNTNYHLYSTAAGAMRFYVGSAGTVFAVSTTISAISDQRLKENVQDLDAGLDAVMALKPRKFDWKAGKGKNTKGDRGFIAQEFEQVFPDLIDEWKDPSPEGEEPYKSVRADLIPVLVKSIQEQQAMIAQLQADIASLKGTA